MNQQEKTYTVPISQINPETGRKTHKRVEMTKDEFNSYLKDINTFRRKQMRRGECFCYSYDYCSCDMDCYNCKYHIYENEHMVDPQSIKRGDEYDDRDVFDTLPSEGPLPDELVEKTIDLGNILSKIKETMPEIITLGNLRQAGKSDTEIAKQLGIPRTTLNSRINKLRDELRECFPEYFDIF